jgi:hypothetical protein
LSKIDINERNNELVKILQALRNKNVGVPSQNQPKKPEEVSKTFPQSNAPKSAPTAANPAPAPAPKQNEAVEQKYIILYLEKPSKSHPKRLIRNNWEHLQRKTGRTRTMRTRSD